MSASHNETNRLVEIFPDLPVEKRSDLAFEFEGLARTLAELAWNPRNQTPFTAVVKGDWGRGKTTLLRQTRGLLDEPPEDAPPTRRKVFTLWFNAWKYPDETTVLAGLLGQLLKRLSTGNLAEQAGLMMRKSRGRLARLALGIAAPWLRDLAEGDRLTSGAEEKRAFYDTFRELFAEGWLVLQKPSEAVKDLTHRKVEEALIDSQGEAALAVFLDDLDRCRQERVMEVMEAVNLFLDLPGVCFYLGVDWTRLRQILEQEMPGREEAFLEKIVQVSMDLPPVSETGVATYVRQLLSGTAFAQVLRDDDVEALAAALGSSPPRRVKRFLNDLSVGLAVLRNTDKLGEGGQQVPERAVVAWHLLLAALPVAEREDLRAGLGNLEGFLRRWGALAEAGEGKPAPEGVSEAMTHLHSRGRLSAQKDELTRLTSAQLNTLVHFGSPPREERPRPYFAAGSRALDLADLEGNAWVALQGGAFVMGFADGKDAHRVEVASFHVSRYPVTNEQYARFVAETVAETNRSPPRHWDGTNVPAGLERHPVVNVSWTDARAFCEWLTSKISEGSVNLPSEAQWEFAARGSEGRTYPWGSEPPDENRANFGNRVGGTTPVDAYPAGATPTGVYDLAGNVWEWCQDRSHPSYDGAPTDGSAWDEGGTGSRVLRGGSFFGDAPYLRAAYRLSYLPDNRYDLIGFRVVWSAAGGQE